MCSILATTLLPPKELYLVIFQRRLIRVVNQAAKARVYQDTVVQVRPLLVRVRMKKDTVLDAGHDQALVPYIDSDHIANMNGLSVVVTHEMTSNDELEGPAGATHPCDDCQGVAACQTRTPSLSPKASNVSKYSIAPERRTLTT
jgi:hypothetical protein